VRGTVYTETVVWSPPEAFLNDAPYQLVIVTLEDGKRVTGRVLGERVKIGDTVELAEHRNGTPYFKPSL
jgi:uncharacterized OB-fold protein